MHNEIAQAIEEAKASGRPFATGEMKMWHLDDSVTTIPLSDKEIWTLVVLIEGAEEKTRNDETFANTEGRKNIESLAIKIAGAYRNFGRREA